MRVNEVVRRPKKVKEPPVPYNPGWEDLNYLKQEAHQTGQRMANTYQLFVPRKNRNADTRVDRNREVIKNRYAFDDEGNLRPEYEKWINRAATNEAAPTLVPGKGDSPPGNNKPSAKLWTSTASQTKDGSFISDWARWVFNNQRDWHSEVGYLYRVKPGALILKLDHDSDAERIMWAFENLGRVAADDTFTGTEWEHEHNMRHKFPWNEVVKHFDAVHHGGWSRQGFMYGWDCESTAWFDTSFLEKVGEVKVQGMADED